MTKLGFEREAAQGLQGRDLQALRHGAGHRPDRQRQDHHAVLGARPSSTRSPRTSPPPRIRSSTTCVGINQVQMHEDIGLNFADALRALPAPGPRHHHGRRDARLRDRRDRDQGRAHRPPGALARCTPTTRRRPSSRLLNMGVEPFLVASSVNLVLAQRLARVICSGLQGAGRGPSAGAGRARRDPRGSAHRRPASTAAAARSAAAPATAAASRSTR